MQRYFYRVDDVGRMIRTKFSDPPFGCRISVEQRAPAAPAGRGKPGKSSRARLLFKRDITTDLGEEYNGLNTRKMTKKPASTGHYSRNVSLAKKPNKNGVRKARKRKQRKALPYLTIPEKERFFKAIDSARDRAIFRLLYHHGLRASEIGKLELADYRPGSTTELDRIKITRLKGSISGECTVVPAAAIAVRSWLRKRGTRAGALFPSRFRTPISRKRIWALMKRYCTRAGIPAEKAHPHCLKHTCCTHLISDQREDIMAVRSHVGHVNVRNTLIYAEMMDEATEARAKRLRNWK